MTPAEALGRSIVLHRMVLGLARKELAASMRELGWAPETGGDPPS